MKRRKKKKKFRNQNHTTLIVQGLLVLIILKCITKVDKEQLRMRAFYICKKQIIQRILLNYQEKWKYSRNILSNWTLIHTRRFSSTHILNITTTRQSYLGKLTGGSKLPTRIPRSMSLSSNFLMKGWLWKDTRISNITISKEENQYDKL